MQKRRDFVEIEIIKRLSKGPRNKIDLRDTIVSERDVTPQAFYKIFSKLKEEEVLTVSRDLVSLSAVWVQREINRINAIAHAYGVSGHQIYGNLLQGSVKKVYKFKTLRELDLFWVHAILMIMQGAYKNKPILSLLPHHWFDLLRPETNTVWYQLLGKHVPHFNVLTHATSSEKKHIKMVDVKKHEIMFNENPLNQTEATYLNVVGDMVFEARLDQGAVSAIREAMQGKIFNREQLIDRLGKYQLSIERNPKRADTIRKKVQKYFTTSLV
jgi:hypothetical protein